MVEDDFGPDFDDDKDVIDVEQDLMDDDEVDWRSYNFPAFSFLFF